MNPILRPARSTDAGTTGAILHGFSRENDWMPELHSLAEAIAFCGTMIDRGWVTVVEEQAQVLGFLARDGQEICALYLSGPARRQGVGRQLLDDAKEKRARLTLRTFEANTAARQFYERNGFVEAGRSDGARNDENLPDITYVWQKEDDGHDQRSGSD
ncbi:GNAT family N-acetyltransferase [Ruegeria sediminis]|uniref:GNAT family N-acetyltransferase n=1 Tax=Ruegeria sediminis TaxID=2583820 RepID=A0ABY2WYG8_9RHOB|nr:GNAT family N-acetyltransferase [Ruegeria sediminis]TMV07666.1 GNAT family N-acetyltransferase [Ruegeria sediminis]